MLFGNLRNTVKTSKNIILEQLVCNFFQTKDFSMHITAMKICFFARNYALIARFKVIFKLFKPAPILRRDINY